ncbi:MAG: hypothetical protein R6W76_04550 [Caldilinea sp.]
MKWNRRFMWMLIGSAVLLLAACQPVRPVTELTPAPVDALQLSAAEHAMADASIEFVAETLDVASESLRVQSVEAMQWPDASIGCPQPEMIYAAVITPGYKITLVSEAETYAVHTDSRTDGEKIICTQE